MQKEIIDYKQKYIKYKAKYLDLKEEVGGSSNKTKVGSCKALNNKGLNEKNLQEKCLDSKVSKWGKEYDCVYVPKDVSIKGKTVEEGCYSSNKQKFADQAEKEIAEAKEAECIKKGFTDCENKKEAEKELEELSDFNVRQFEAYADRDRETAIENANTLNELLENGFEEMYKKYKKTYRDFKIKNCLENVEEDGYAEVEKKLEKTKCETKSFLFPAKWKHIVFYGWIYKILESFQDVTNTRSEKTISFLISEMIDDGGGIQFTNAGVEKKKKFSYTTDSHKIEIFNDLLDTIEKKINKEAKNNDINLLYIKKNVKDLNITYFEILEDDDVNVGDNDDY
jgi:hypothetical protein